MAEFLPLCDLLFNVVSLAAYFCNVVFDLLVVYALYERGLHGPCLHCLLVILTATLAVQALSLHWYLHEPATRWRRGAIVLLHLLQLGVLWRYTRLLVPVQLPHVKHQVRDLCVLRLVDGFLQAAPMLLLQLSLLARAGAGAPRDLLVVSAALSLFSLCWALASFSKHIRDVDRLVLTWLGVVSQLLWRLGTVSSRAIALTAYAATYHEWVYLVFVMHWVCVFLWLLSPRSTFHAQTGNRLGVCALVAAMYVVAYINFQAKPHRRTMTIFYIVMLLENMILVCAYLASVWSTRPTYWHCIPLLTCGLFCAGIVFMLLYYRFFHVHCLLEKPTSTTGVFNCRFASASLENGTALSDATRKKKKPTTFVPPPTLGPVAVPFWRRPLPSSSENEGSSVGSRVNIHQKLQEKKQKQLAELKIIEEEIKQGKLGGPLTADPDDRQPIPRAKRHIEPQLLSLASLSSLANYGINFNRRPAPRAPRSRTPELLLTPRYLFCECGALPELDAPDTNELTASDLESQFSLPRSYTLPREFKYYRHGRRRRAAPAHAPTAASANSSDGDVDSADEESDYVSPSATIQLRRLRYPYRHETKL